MKYGLRERFTGKLMKIKNQKLKSRQFGFKRKIERSSSIKYRPELDGIRAIAIIFVVLNHSGLLSWGSLGVDIFFVISGYLITDILLKSQNSPSRIKNFYIGRIARLFPVLILYSLIGCIVSSIFLKQWFNISQPLTALLQIKNFFQLDASYRDIWAHTWSLSAEEQFYAIWPFLLFFFIQKIQKKYILIIIIAYILVAHRSLIMMNNLWSDLFNRYFDYGSQVVAVIIRPSEILLGCLITLSRPISRMLIFWLFASATCVAALLGVSLFLTVALATASLLAILEISSPLTKALSWILGRKILVSIGVLSYSIYLWHALIGIVFFEYFGRAIQVKLVTFVLTLIVSYISYIWFEIPIQKILKRKFITKDIVNHS